MLLDLVFVFAGATSRNVIEQYTDIVGRPAMPPYWALGYHVGRHGETTSIDDAMEFVTQLRISGIPMDAYWQDFEYMIDDGHALSLNEKNFSHKDLHAFIDDLHFHSQYFVCVQVPAITLTNTSMTNGHGHDMARHDARKNVKQTIFALHAYDEKNDSEDAGYEKDDDKDDNTDAFGGNTTDKSGSDQGETCNHDSHSDSDDQSGGDQDDRGDHSNDEKDRKEKKWDPIVRGEELDVFVKGVNGERYTQKALRSGWAVFIDFFHPEASRYWHEHLTMFHKYVVPFDGL